MLNHFIRHIRSKSILDFQKSYLLGISGGIDSVCLGYLLKESGINFSLAHVNFQLRGDESDADEAFVRALGEKWEIPVHVKRTHPDEFRQDHQSIQMAARDFRYSWFEELIFQHDFEGVLIAHHFEDQIETILLNLLRGTGIEGIFGMADRRDKIIRPLLPFRRKEIEDFMDQHLYVWRNDSSNNKNDYKRNFLRNEIMPTLSRVFPDPNLSLDHSFQRLKDTGRAFFYLYEQWKEKVVKQEEGYQNLKIEEFKRLPGNESMLYYWLRDFGFNYDDVLSILEATAAGESGKTFSSGRYVLNVDRDLLILGKEDFEFPLVELMETDIGLKLKDAEYEMLRLTKGVDLDRSPLNAMLDLDKLTFPLVVRKWEQGDRFVPLGMQNEKKISDLLIDLKVPLIYKKTVAVLCSGDEIAWVIGYRISDRFKCDSNTKTVLYFKKKER